MTLIRTRNFLLSTCLLVLLVSCAVKIEQSEAKNPAINKIADTSLVLLGTVQDGGFPHIGCAKTCCQSAFNNPDEKREVISLGLIDATSNKSYLFEATPDLPKQMKRLLALAQNEAKKVVDGVFLTHAHIGHYTGLMYLGKEALGADQAKVYAMPRMQSYLSGNGPWSQLLSEKNIVLQDLSHEKTIHLSKQIKVTPFLVPHRDEFSETVGYRIEGPSKTALFIPDIDKWEKWEKDIREQISQVDYAFLDATFYSGAEINNRDISQIPHPFIIESLEKFKDLSTAEKNKIVFIHFNHTNPVIDVKSEEAQKVIRAGFRIGVAGQVFTM